VGAVNYQDLAVKVKASPTRFIEGEGVPKDATVVDYTWRYVNKDGGPDRRFRDNPRLPIVHYEEIDFTSPSGLQERIQCSRVGVAQQLPGTVEIEGLAALSLQGSGTSTNPPPRSSANPSD
jgi:hypothetical protein